MRQWLSCHIDLSFIAWRMQSPASASRLWTSQTLICALASRVALVKCLETPDTIERAAAPLSLGLSFPKIVHQLKFYLFVFMYVHVTEYRWGSP